MNLKIVNCLSNSVRTSRVLGQDARPGCPGVIFGETASAHRLPGPVEKSLSCKCFFTARGGHRLVRTEVTLLAYIVLFFTKKNVFFGEMNSM